MLFFLFGLRTLMAQDAQLPLLHSSWGEVVFNELMADPHPPVGLDEEYLELFNRSDKAVELEGWILFVNQRRYELSEDLIPGGTILEPGSYGLIKNIVLPNEGAMLSLYNTEGHLVHGASYATPWDGMPWKKEGGWALESPDPEQVCILSELWEYSEDPQGGTPGRINSRDAILMDQLSPVLLYTGFAQADPGDEGEGSSGILRLYFSEALRMSPSDLPEIVLQPGNLSSLEVKIPGPMFRVLELRFPADLRERTFFRVNIPRVVDCQANERALLEARAGSTDIPVFGSLQINEIMYEPEDGMPEFIEIFLPGNRFYDLKDLALHVEDKGDPAGHPLPLSDHSRLMVPGSYLVICRNEEHLRYSYHLERSGQWVGLEKLPGLPNGGGTIYLTDRAGNVVDQADYDDEMHAEILSDTKGVSLERISYDRSGDDPHNWHSAASLQGFATPGRQNSQALGEAESILRLEVEPTVFSPDNDGYQDLLQISISNGEPGWVMNIRFTDLQGNTLRILANNHLCGPKILYTWDGARDDGSMVPPGICVVHVWAYHPPTGKRWIRKRAVGLVYR